MKLSSKLILVLLMSYAGSAFPHARVADLVDEVKRGVVNLQVTSVRQEVVSIGPEFGDFFNFFGLPKMRRTRKAVSRGSGFFISSDGYIVTNHHVVAGAEQVIAILGNQKRLNARVIGSDQKYDLALLKVKRSSQYIGLKLGDSDKARIGEDLIAIGNPFGLQHSVTRGILSAKHRTIGAGPYDDFLQTDAAINPGNSGGPLFNMEGEVIGVSSIVLGGGPARSAQGIGFAIPINIVKDVVGQLKKHGRVLRQWLGIVADNVSSYFPRYVGGYRSGVLITNLITGGPADKSGLQIGDIILEVNRKKITNSYDLQRAIVRKNKKILLKVVRGEKIFIKLVPLEMIPKEEVLPYGYRFI